MPEENQMTSGETFLHILDFIVYKWGTNGLNIYNKQNTINFNTIYKEQLYPLEDYIKALEDLQDIFKDENIPYKIGLHRGKNLTIGKGMGRNPLETLDKVISVWDKFNNFGDVKIKKHNENKLSIIISNYKSNPLYCDRMRGFFEGIVSGGSQDKCDVSETSCISSGCDTCEFIIEIKK